MCCASFRQGRHLGGGGLEGSLDPQGFAIHVNLNCDHSVMWPERLWLLQQHYITSCIYIKQLILATTLTPLLLPSVTLMLKVLRRQHPLTRASTKLTIQSNPFCRHFPRENTGSDLLQCRSVQSVWLDWILSVRGLCVLVLHEILSVDSQENQ